MKKKLLIFGAGETATIAAEFFLADTREVLAGFVVDDIFWTENMTQHGYPVYPISQIRDSFSTKKYKFFVALSYGELNRQRLKAFNLIDALEFEITSYISSNAMIWRTSEIGRNCMIFEGNNIQHRAKIEDNVILWSGNHIGHGSTIGNSVYISSHACIAGEVDIRDRSFIGVNSTIIDKVAVKEDCFITAGTLINKSTKPNSIYSGNPGVRNEKVTAKKFFKVRENFDVTN